MEWCNYSQEGERGPVSEIISVGRQLEAFPEDYPSASHLGFSSRFVRSPRSFLLSWAICHFAQIIIMLDFVLVQTLHTSEVLHLLFSPHNILLGGGE